MTADRQLDQLAAFLEDFLTRKRQITEVSIRYVDAGDQDIPDDTLLDQGNPPDPLFKAVAEKMHYLIRCCSLLPGKCKTDKLLLLTIQWAETTCVLKLTPEDSGSLIALSGYLQDSSALPGLYTAVATHLPSTGSLIRSLNRAALGDLLNLLLRCGGLNEDILAGMLAALPELGSTILRALSANIRCDLENHLQRCETPDPVWAAESLLLFRWNLLSLLHRGAADRLQLADNYAHLNMQMESLLLGVVQQSIPQLLKLTSVETASGVLARIGERTLVLAQTVLEEGEKHILEELLPRKKTKRIREDAVFAAAHFPLHARRAAKFRLFQALARAAAKTEPFLKKDLQDFLQQNSDPASRIFLLMASGITTVVEGLRIGGDPLTAAFTAVLPDRERHLIVKMVAGKIRLANSGYKYSVHNPFMALCIDWKGIALSGFWGKS